MKGVTCSVNEILPYEGLKHKWIFRTHYRNVVGMFISPYALSVLDYYSSLQNVRYSAECELVWLLSMISRNLTH
jgi:hypothetical protein